LGEDGWLGARRSGVRRGGGWRVLGGLGVSADVRAANLSSVGGMLGGCRGQWVCECGGLLLAIGRCGTVDRRWGVARGGRRGGGC